MNLYERLKRFKDQLTQIQEAGTLQETGRTLSQANEKKLKDAVAAIQDVLSKLDQGQQVAEAQQKELVQDALDLLEAERTHREVRALVRQALKRAYPGDAWGPFIEDLTTDNYVIFEREPVENQMYLLKMGFNINDDNTVTFDNNPVEVIKKQVYEPVGQQQESNQESQEGGCPGSCNHSIQENSETITEYIPLKEARTIEGQDEGVPIKCIGPGWGNSGYYQESVLKRDAGAYKPGTLMFVDHQTQQEAQQRPEGSMKNLAGVLVEGGQYDANGPEGPGIYAKGKLFSDHKDDLLEKAPYTGLSHNAYGSSRHGEAEGKQGPIIEHIAGVQSIDIVTKPAAGGQLLTESDRKGGQQNNNNEEGEDMNLEEAKKENQRLKEALVMREAQDFISKELENYEQLPKITKDRITESLKNDFEMTEDEKLDQEKMKEKVKEAATKELEYISQLTGQGQVKGMNSGDSTFNEAVGGGQEPDPQKTEETLTEAFKGMGYSEEAAKQAAKGRE